MNDAALAAEPISLPVERSCPFDPPPELAQLRETQPLCRLQFPDGHVGWLVTSYALSRAILADPRFSWRVRRAPVGDPIERVAVVAALEGYQAVHAGSMLDKDPPQHTRLRKLQTRYFTVRAGNEHRERIGRIVAGCLDAMQVTAPPADLVEAFAFPVASMTACELLGVPHSDRHRFEAPVAIVQSREATIEQKVAAIHEYGSFVRGVIEGKRVRPDDALLSHLVATGELSDDELVGAGQLLFLAAHETSANQLALSIFALLYERERWELLRAEPSLIDGAVEELLRYLTINQLDPTITALEDVELEGLVIKTNETVMVSLPAANRDPERFADPDRLDLRRDASGHLAFAHGRHMCLGQHLARLELQVSLTGLIERFPTLRLAVPADDVAVHNGEAVVHGVVKLPVAW